MKNKEFNYLSNSLDDVKDKLDYLLRELKKIDSKLFSDISNQNISDEEILNNANILLKYIDQFNNTENYKLELKIQDKKIILNFALDDRHKIIKNVNNISQKYLLPLTNHSHYLLDIDKDIEWNKAREDLFQKLISIFNELKKGNSPKGIWLSGEFGVGKTHILISFLNFISKNLNKSVCFIFWTEFIIDYQNNLSSNSNISSYQKLNFLKNAPVLVIDDIGSERINPWMRDNIFFPILNHRLETKKLTFFTSNLSINEYAKFLKSLKSNFENKGIERIISRITSLIEYEIKLIDRNHRLKSNLLNI